MTELAWGGYTNARDLGGLPTSLAGGGATIPGRLARGPRRERLDTAGWNAARHWGPSTIVDLRCAYETGAQTTDPVVPAEALAGFMIRHTPTEDHEDPAFRQTCFPILDSPRILEPQLAPAAAPGAGGARSHCRIHPGRAGPLQPGGTAPG